MAGFWWRCMEILAECLRLFFFSRLHCNFGPQQRFSHRNCTLSPKLSQSLEADLTRLVLLSRFHVIKYMPHKKKKKEMEKK